MSVCPDLDNTPGFSAWCLVNERGAGYCMLFTPYPVFEWCPEWIVRCRPDRRYTHAVWPRCKEKVS